MRFCSQHDWSHLTWAQGAIFQQTMFDDTGGIYFGSMGFNGVEDTQAYSKAMPEFHKVIALWLMGLHRLGGFLLVSCHLLDVFLKALFIRWKWLWDLNIWGKRPIFDDFKPRCSHNFVGSIAVFSLKLHIFQTAHDQRTKRRRLQGSILRGLQCPRRAFPNQPPERIPHQRLWSGWWYTPLKNDGVRQLGWLFPKYGKS